MDGTQPTADSAAMAPSPREWSEMIVVEWTESFGSKMVTLSLGPDVLRLTRRSGETVATTELGREDAGLLVRWVSGGRNAGPEAYKVQLDDKSGQVRLELMNRNVEVDRSPGAGDSAAPGAYPMVVPLDVLIGTWWPDSSRRISIRERGFFALLGGPTEYSWGQPDLSGYPAYATRRAMWGAKIIIGVGIVFGVLASVLGYSSQDRSLARNEQMRNLAFALVIAVLAVGLILLGLWSLRDDKNEQH